jgi:threonine/homoserine/homoserine lactone efflux protein
MIESIISGIGLGVLLSFLTGPAFFALLKTSIEKGFYAGASFAIGVLISDIIFVSLAIFGSSYIALDQTYMTPLGILGSLILLGIGFYYLVIKVKICKNENLCNKEYTGFIIKGIAMCIFNPAILLYWISVTGGVISVTGKFNIQEIVPFFATILITQFTIDCLKAFFANKLSHRIEEKTIGRINKMAGVFIIIFALRLMYEVIFTQPLITL